MTVPPIRFAALSSTLTALRLGDGVRLAELEAIFLGAKVSTDSLDVPVALTAVLLALNAGVQNAGAVSVVAHSTDGGESRCHNTAPEYRPDQGFLAWRSAESCLIAQFACGPFREKSQC